MRVAVVLGAGGAAGWVYHAGVARTLREETGWDVRSADLLIGTSAGAAVAASLRAGTDPQHIADSVTRGPSEEERAAYREQMAARKRSLRPLAPRLAKQALAGNGSVAVGLAGLLPPGWFPTEPLGRFPGVDEHRHWPTGLWIPAVRVDDGAVIVFGRDRTDASVSEAVEASSAVPGLFAPKAVGVERFVDGGLASPSHAHLAAAVSPDLVIVSSPLTRPSRRPMPTLARRRLGPERRLLDERGIRHLVIEPAAEANELFRGFPRRNPEAAPRIVALGAEATRVALSGSGYDEVLGTTDHPARRAGSGATA